MSLRKASVSSVNSPETARCPPTRPPVVVWSAATRGRGGRPAGILGTFLQPKRLPPTPPGCVHAGPRVVQQLVDPTQHTLRGTHLCHDGEEEVQVHHVVRLGDIQQDDSAAAALGGVLGEDHKDLREGVPDVPAGEEGRLLSQVNPPPPPGVRRPQGQTIACRMPLQALAGRLKQGPSCSHQHTFLLLTIASQSNS
eukprot:363618-Chlamydomonas_euryale.AAC.8